MECVKIENKIGKDIIMERKNAWKGYSPEELAQVEALSEKYKAFLDAGKTERECVAEIVKMAEGFGYTDLEEAYREGRRL